MKGGERNPTGRSQGARNRVCVDRSSVVCLFLYCPPLRWAASQGSKVGRTGLPAV